MKKGLIKLKKSRKIMVNKRIKIILIRSIIGKPEKQRKIVASLGLRKLHHEVVHDDVPSIRGMIHKIPHMLEVTDVKDAK